MTPVPKCPECGKAPRNILRPALLREVISFNKNGTRNFHNSKPFRHLVGPTMYWRCGGGHEWEYRQADDPMYDDVLVP